MMRVLTVHIISLNFPVGTLDVCKVFHICALISLFLSLVLIVYFIFFSGSAWFAEMALEHQPAPTKPASAHEGGRRRGGQGVCMPFLRPC